MNTQSLHTMEIVNYPLENNSTAERGIEPGTFWSADNEIIVNPAGDDLYILKVN